MSDKISDVIRKLETMTAREALDNGEITQDDYFIEYGKYKERIRIIDAITNSDLEPFTKIDLVKLIRGEQ
jgi:hypothetical protein